MPIENVPDSVFADKLLGDGIAINPSDGEIISPIDGQVVMIQDSLHAIGIQSEDGIEISIHVGLDTVELKGEGFVKKVNIKDRVNKGQPIVCFDKDDSLRVKHFVSDSNDDISDPAGKFQEALSKLVAWNETKQLDTVAMKEFEDLYHREAYPGLGTVKKLSIMHHLELIGRYLDKE